MSRSPQKSVSLNRRAMLSLSGRTLLAATLAYHGVRAGYASDAGINQAEQWVRRLDNVSKRLASGNISGLHWQEALDEIYGSVPMESLLKMVDFKRLSDQLSSQDLGDRGEIFHDITVGPIPAQDKIGGEDSGTAIVKIAHVKKGRSIPPHGHSNMVSAFLCVSGEFEVKLFDRLHDFEETMVVRKTVDEKSVGPGTWSSISDYRNNVHWLTANSDDCFLFTCKLIRLEEDREFNGRINLNLKTAEQLGSNTWRARKISGAEASELY